LESVGRQSGSVTLLDGENGVAGLRAKVRVGVIIKRERIINFIILFLNKKVEWGA
jgi:hypothetical protein